MKTTYELEKKAKEIWYDYVKNNTLPPGIPKHPDKVYKGKGWVGWCDWIGVFNINNN
jgi:hypothetical protein